MAKAEPFNLGLEVETYLNRLDNNLLLDTEESDELFDHFHCEVEELTSLGLSITYFILNIMWSSAPLTSDTILLFVKAESLNPIFAKYLDFGLKMAIIMGSAYYLIRQIRVGRINKYALACIPFVGLLLDFASLPIRSLGLALHHNSDIYPILAGSFATNSKIIMLISWTLLIGFTAFLWRKHYSHIRLTN